MKDKKIYKINKNEPSYHQEIKDFFDWGFRNGYKAKSNEEYFYYEPIFKTEEERLEILRKTRKPLLDAFDKWEKAVLRGRESESIEVMTWYFLILDLNETALNNIPERVKYYL